MKRNEDYLRALRTADEALYRLWKLTEIKSPIFYAISALQHEHIHPEIHKEDKKVKT